MLFGIGGAIIIGGGILLMLCLCTEAGALVLVSGIVAIFSNLLFKCDLGTAYAVSFFGIIIIYTLSLFLSIAKKEYKRMNDPR